VRYQFEIPHPREIIKSSNHLKDPPTTKFVVLTTTLIYSLPNLHAFYIRRKLQIFLYISTSSTANAPITELPVRSTPHPTTTYVQQQSPPPITQDISATTTPFQLTLDDVPTPSLRIYLQIYPPPSSPPPMSPDLFALTTFHDYSPPAPR